MAGSGPDFARFGGNGAGGEVDRLITTREFEINKPFAGDMTLLSSACLNENGREVVDALLAKGGDPNFKTYGGMTPLMYAASNRHGNVYCLKKLLSMGVAPNATDNRRRTALMFAATQRNPEFVRLLLAYGANVNARICEAERPCFMPYG